MRAIVLDRPGSFRVAEVPDPTPGEGQIVVKVDCLRDLRHRHPHHGRRVPADARTRSRRATSSPARSSPSAGDVARSTCRSAPRWRSTPRCTAATAAGAGPAGTTCARTGRPSATPWTARSPSTSRSPRSTRTGCPDGVDGQLGAMVEPLACAVHGLRRLGPLFGDSVVLTGAGTMGLLLLQLLVHSGAGRSPWSTGYPTGSRSPASSARPTSRPSLDELADERFEIAVDATGVAGRGRRRGRAARPGRPAARLRRGAGRGDDEPVAVPRLQRRDHRHRLDGDPAQLRPGGGADRQRRDRPAPAAVAAAAAGRVRRGAAAGSAPARASSGTSGPPDRARGGRPRALAAGSARPPGGAVCGETRWR